MFENYSREVCCLFKAAENIRENLKHEYVGTEHLVLAILKENNDFVKSLENFGLNYERFYKEIISVLEPSHEFGPLAVYTPLLKKIIIKCQKENAKVSAKELLFYILKEGEGVAIRLMMALDVDVDALYNALKNKSNDLSLEISKYGSVLNESVNLNEKVIGRNREINLIVETLLRKKKNNPLLIGDAGVGKSAIVEQLARNIALGDICDELASYKIVALEMGKLVAGTKYRGEFEDRLSSVIDEVVKSGNVIIFIDEIHAMVNAGGAEGAICASDILKPYLARGNIKCIGATTKKEYEKYFSKDKALMRRFENILVSEPNENETYEIVQKVKKEYETYHKVKIKDELIKTLVHLATIYFPDKKNPDKSLELLDSVMAFVKLKEENILLKEKEQKLKSLEIKKIREIENANYKEALRNNVLEKKLRREIELFKNGVHLSVKNEDILEVLEHKNNLYINKNKDSIAVFKKKYKKIIDNKLDVLNFQKNMFSILTFGNIKDFASDLAKSLNYKVFTLESEDDLTKICEKVKYYPSSIIVTSKNLLPVLEKIKKSDFFEYNDNVYSFKNVIFLIKEESASIGFGKQKAFPEKIIDVVLDFTLVES